MTQIFEPLSGTPDRPWHNLNHFSVTTKIFEPVLGAPDRSWHNPNNFKGCDTNIWVFCRCFWQVTVHFFHFTCNVFKLSAHLLGLVLTCGKIQKQQQFLCYIFELLVLNTSRFIQKSAHILVYNTVKALDHIGVLYHMNIRLWTS